MTVSTIPKTTTPINIYSPTTFITSVVIGDAVSSASFPFDPTNPLGNPDLSPGAGGTPLLPNGTNGQPISAALCLASIYGGFVLSNMTTAQRNALNPFPGMMVYTTDLAPSGGISVYINTGWIEFSQGNGNVSGTSPTVIGNLASWDAIDGSQITDSGIPLTNVVQELSLPDAAGNIPVYINTSTKFVTDSGMNIIDVGGTLTANASPVVGNQLSNVSIIEFVTANLNTADCAFALENANTLDTVYLARLFRTSSGTGSIVVSNNLTGVMPSSQGAILEVQSTESTFLNARMTFSQMNAIVSPQDGMQVYVQGGATTGLYIRQGGAWNLLSEAGTSPFPFREAGSAPTISLFMGTGFNTTATGTSNLGIGENALPGLITGNNNIWIGSPNSLLSSSINGSSGNTIIGELPNIATNSILTSCIFLGTNVGSGFATTATDCVIIGRDASFLAGPTVNRFIIGNDTTNNNDNSMVIGGELGSSTALNVGIGTQNPAAALHVNGGQIGRVHTLVATNSTYNVVNTDYIIGVQRVSATTQFINLPPLSGTTVGQIFFVSDINGDSTGGNAIRVIANGGAEMINRLSGVTIMGEFISVGFMRTTTGYVTLTVGGIPGSTTLNVRDVTTDTIVTPSDGVVVVTDTSAPRSITLPAASRLGESVVIKDGSGGAATNNITITPVSGLIDGNASVVINTNYGSLTFVSDGTNYYII